MHFCDIVNESFRLCPTEAGVSDGLTVYAFTDLLCAVLDVAFDHEALDELVDIGILAAYLTAEAEDQGLGSCILGWPDDDPHRTKKRKDIEELVSGVGEG